MKSFSIYVWHIAIVFLLLPISRPLLAQPGPGVQWVDRALAYAQEFWEWPNYNFRYCNWHSQGVDCANFCSQIANAGCAGQTS
ncbi:MAG: amidase domain-containing protein [candidate division Zixibacteria bacterium]|nr:amidase domain-containing protein [candidate division Zixibacteria bacterium]